MNMQSSSTRAPTAVVVEDEWILRAEIADALLESGWRVASFPTGESALAYAKAGLLVDVLITDIRFPGAVTGWDVATEFRNADDTIGVIYCSGNADSDVRRVTDAVFVSKPCPVEQLIAIAGQMAERHLCAGA